MRALIPILLLAALATGGCDRQSATGSQAEESLSGVNAAAASLGDKLDRTHKGEPAPALSFTDAAGRKRTVADFAGKPVLLNLWATWCAPCVKEMPTLDALAMAKGESLHVLTVSQDIDSPDTKATEKVASFFAEAKYRTLRPYLDSDLGWSMTLGVNLPTTFLFDSAGREVWRLSGDLDWTSPTAAALLGEAG